MIVVQQEGVNSCIWPCSDSSPYYYTTDQTCKSSCSDPYLGTKEDYGTTCSLSLSASDQKQISNIVTVTSTVNTISTVSLATASIASASNPAAVTGSTMVKVLAYTRYLNITHSARLEATFVGLQTSTGVFDSKQIQLGSSTKSKFKEHTAPTMFEKYNVSPTFLIGFWAGLISLLILATVALFVMIIDKRIIKLENKKLLKRASRKLKDTFQNYLITQFYDSYGDVMLFAGLEFRSSKFSSNLSILSFIAAMAMTIIGLVMLYIHIRILKKYQEVRREEEQSNAKTSNKLKKFTDEYSGVKTLFNDFKDNSFIHQAFLLFFVIRSILIGIILTAFVEYPLVQISLFTTTSILMLGYVITVKPFKEVLDFIQQIAFELVILAVNASMLTMAILDLKHEGSTRRRYYVGETVIQANLVSQFLPTIFLVLKCIAFVKELYEKLKERRRAKVGILTSTSSPLAVEPIAESRNKILDYKLSSRSAKLYPFSHKVAKISTKNESRDFKFDDESAIKHKQSVLEIHTKKTFMKDLEKDDFLDSPSENRVLEKTVAKYSDWLLSPPAAYNNSDNLSHSPINQLQISHSLNAPELMQSNIAKRNLLNLRRNKLPINTLSGEISEDSSPLRAGRLQNTLSKLTGDKQ